MPFSLQNCRRKGVCPLLCTNTSSMEKWSYMEAFMRALINSNDNNTQFSILTPRYQNMQWAPNTLANPVLVVYVPKPSRSSSRRSTVSNY